MKMCLCTAAHSVHLALGPSKNAAGFPIQTPEPAECYTRETCSHEVKGWKYNLCIWYFFNGLGGGVYLSLTNVSTMSLA